MPKISVCVPVYNVEQYIGRCIESIQHQTLKDIEIIIVNDCTPDNSMQIVENYAIQDSRIKVINHESNKGLMWARRTGYMAAVGDYITFCDSDDTLVENAVELLYNKAMETNADIVSGNISYIDNTNKITTLVSTLKYGSEKKSIYKSLLKKECRHNLCSKLFKREVLQNYEYKTFDHFINGEDGCLFYQIIENSSKMVQISESVYNYYQNLESSTQVQLSEEAIKSIVIVNRIKIEKCSKYYDLSKDLYCCVSESLNSLYTCKSDYSDKIDYYIKNYNLDNFVNIQFMLKYLPIKKVFLMLLRKITSKI